MSLRFRKLSTHVSILFWVFYKHELVKQYQYYWRIEPGIKMYCDIDFDVFEYMIINDKNMDL